MRLLLIEDDRMIGDSVCQGLRQDCFAVDWVRDGVAAELAMDGGEYDCVLLDLGLPRRDGVQVLKSIRSKGLDVPVLVLTARDAVASRIEVLDAGADDYIGKPFDLDELSARIRAVMRRRAGRARSVIRVGALMLDPVTRRVEFDDAALTLSPNEFSLLEVLASRPGMVYSRAQLEQKLYGWGQESDSNTVEVYIHNLRRKLGQRLIKNVRGVGYTLPREP